MWAPIHNDYLYSFVEMQRFAMGPLRTIAKFNKEVLGGDIFNNRALRTVSAGFEMFERITRNYPKPEFGIKTILIGDKEIKIKEKILIKKPFCNLVHFEKVEKLNLPKILVVAPMSGHHATLLRGTVEGLLPHFDVYITDWIDAKQVPTEEGAFRFDCFVNYCIEFFRHIGKNLNVLAVCQPSVPVMVAVSLMSEEKDPFTPKTMMLMGGPIDTRKSPTEVNDYAAERTINWFDTNAITRVPVNYPGAGRRVYPGFLQLAGFMAMNLKTHIDAHNDLYSHLIEGDGESADAHRKFYNEYLAVMDLPASFYVETVDIVFKQHLLPRGKLMVNGRNVDPTAIKNTALLCIEGERDDISGRGQTKAAINVCSNIPDSKKEYYLQKGVGHYGIFNGRRYREEVVPVIVKFAKKHCK
ncbi:polyhydroxyalkanoate depolymerase [Rickettsiales bacterium]|nr:polyhydroxyalkanoate depolymerase [Rickettsiales bacterium]